VSDAALTACCCSIRAVRETAGCSGGAACSCGYGGAACSWAVAAPPPARITRPMIAAERVMAYLMTVRMTPPPAGTASGATATRVSRKWIVTVRPQATPTAAPNTTSLVQCWLAVMRDAAV